jgi:hypothetical protein
VAKIVPPPPRPIPVGSGDVTAALKERRSAYFPEMGGFAEVPVYDGEKFGAGDVITGPCIIEERMTTLVLPPAETVTVDPEGSYTTISRLLRSDASPQECDGYARETDAGSVNSSAICATEDTLSRRPVHSGGRGLAFQQPPRKGE